MVSPARVRLLAKYGLTPERYDEILASQGGGCCICKRPPKPGKNLCVDHDHKTGAVRGLLCFFCNRILLGRRREDPALHLAAYFYLSANRDWRDRAVPLAGVPDSPRVRRRIRARRVQGGVVPASPPRRGGQPATLHPGEAQTTGGGE